MGAVGVSSLSALKGGGSSLPALEERAGADTASAQVASPRIAPLYKRLPRGPHKLARDEVIRNQRTRIHGGVIEAVAEYGYEETSIKYVLALAGVSRRAFYEHFANKEECFLTTFDLLAARAVKRTNEAYRAAEGALENRLRAAFEQFAEEVGGSSNGATLIEAPMAGPAGMLHLCRATATFEQMLLHSFAHAPEASALPLPVVRGIVGGLYEVMSVRLRPGGRAAKTRALTEELLEWTTMFQTPALDRLAARVSERARVDAGSTNVHVLNGHSVNGHASNGHSMNGNATNGHATNGHAMNGYAMNGHLNNGDASHLDARGRLLQCVLRLTVLEDYGELSVPQIADEADVPLDDFFELFVDKEECFLAAFDEMSDELLALTADPELVGEHWPRAVRRTIGALMRHLADHPLQARMIAAEVYAAGPDAIEHNHELARDIATLLTEGAPEGTGGMLALVGVRGAIFHTIRHQVANGQIHLLPVLADYLTYVVLAPFIGADAAAELVAETQPESEPALGLTVRSD
jgi:AcrR family transcriptional regulator